MKSSENMSQKEVLRYELRVLKREHRDLDRAISALEGTPSADQLMIGRLKRQRLLLKDQITVIEEKLTPDIIA